MFILYFVLFGELKFEFMFFVLDCGFDGLFFVVEYDMQFFVVVIIDFLFEWYVVFLEVLVLLF